MLLFHIVTMIVEEFVPSVNQSIENGIEEIRVQVAESFYYGFLNFGIGFEMATCQMFLRRSEELKIAWCEIWAVMDVLGHPDHCSSRTSVLPSSYSLHQKQTCFRDITLAP
ncbi:hypothetical protein AVEN_194597-1 [Araneus ventricosus]|uniref:Uncharacterized protein n=1 Tax=Araneus ventricosus TaxID=182803 RepID=A0A4Y2A7V8_ARAVE|nr:hypothetical protein AVEN_194597-1 [Araneus ventricosus]